MVARVLFILLESWGNTTTPYPRATVKAIDSRKYWKAGAKVPQAVAEKDA